MGKKELVLRALKNYRGDNLERARAAFKHCTEEEMELQYGQSGKTRRELLQEYIKQRAEVDAAIGWIESLKESV